MNPNSIQAYVFRNEALTEKHANLKHSRVQQTDVANTWAFAKSHVAFMRHKNSILMYFLGWKSAVNEYKHIRITNAHTAIEL